MKIGVFDSGIGGLSVANAIEKALPQAEVIFVTDKANFPYATKSPEQIWQGIIPIFEGLIEQQVDVIVVACNTVSTTLSGHLRDRFPIIPLVALDPMVKPAALETKSGIIAVCATPTTLASQRYADLKQEFASDITVLEPDCSDWSYLIENNQMNEAKIQKDIAPALEAGADVVVLACTHYHWIENEIKELSAGRAQVMQPESTIVEQVKRVLGL
ncbi:MAG TPA: glutamate racemase [Candidatus Microsaccharimonas sp.]|nr:glutamate racemase [Candidatus Microsaccharimonas sp.]